MKAGDLVKHQYGTLQGQGLVLQVFPTPEKVRVLWAAHGRTDVHEVATRFLKVVSKSQDSN